MALEQQQIADSSFAKHDTPLGKWNKMMDDEVGDKDNVSGGFECNICLDLVHEPVVTLCGHLYCWPCIYKWFQFQSVSSENSDQQQQPQCPVCKAEVSQKTLIPLYGRGESTKPSQGESLDLGMVIPQRPLSPRCGGRTLMATIDSNLPQQLHQRSHEPYHQGSFMASPMFNEPYHQGSFMASPMVSLGGTTANMLHPVIGEVAYARIFGNSSTLYTYPNSYNAAASSSRRMRRQLAEADKSLGRICFFLFCCLISCLILF